MSFESIKSAMPAYAKDIKLNFGGMTNSAALNEQQVWGTILSSALASGNKTLAIAALVEAKTRLSEDAYEAAKAANAIMGMNNIYYRFVHLAGNEAYMTMPARLRMQVVGEPGIEKVDFELWSLAVSAVNGCGLCIESHEKRLMKHGATREMIQDAVRIAAILHGVATTLDTEEADAELGEALEAA